MSKYGYCQECGKQFDTDTNRKYCASPAYCCTEAKHKINNPKFQNIMINRDTNFYYLVGLIAADGHLHKHHNGVEITINIKDIKLLEDIQQIFGGKMYIKKDNTVIITISYKPLYDYLVSIGLTTGKSLSLDMNNFFQSLPMEYKTAFVRGVVDGDGGVRLYKTGLRRDLDVIAFDICSGSEKFITMIANYINTEFGYNRVNVEWLHQARAFYIRSMSKFKTIPILDLIYRNSEGGLYLERKRNNYITHKKLIGDQTHRIYNKK